MKICVVKTSSMGDVIHTLPALTDAQQAIPNLQVDWVVEKSFAEIPRWHSAVLQVIPLEIRRWRKQLCQRQTWIDFSQYKAQLQSCHYDAVIDAQGLIKSAVLATRLAKGKKYGYNAHSAREGLSSLFYDHKADISYQQHAVERIRKLFAQSLGYPMPTQIGDYGIARHFAKNLTKQIACPYIVAIHSTTRADKHWAEHYWQQFFEQILPTGLAIHLPWGNEMEYQRAKRLAKISSQIHVLPKLSLSELANEIVNATAVISVDTGLSHLTAALDKPNLILYGATDPILIGAYGKHQHYLKAKGMDKILPEQVWETFQTILQL